MTMRDLIGGASGPHRALHVRGGASHSNSIVFPRAEEVVNHFIVWGPRGGIFGGQFSAEWDNTVVGHLVNMKELLNIRTPFKIPTRWFRNYNNRLLMWNDLISF
jgi:hypothetical protein